MTKWQRFAHPKWHTRSDDAMTRNILWNVIMRPDMQEHIIWLRRDGKELTITVSVELRHNHRQNGSAIHRWSAKHVYDKNWPVESTRKSDKAYETARSNVLSFGPYKKTHDNKQPPLQTGGLSLMKCALRASAASLSKSEPVSQNG